MPFQPGFKFPATPSARDLWFVFQRDRLLLKQSDNGRRIPSAGELAPIKPAPILLGAVLGTQVVATLIAVYGVFMYPLGWGWALAVWGYALIWFLVNDRVKLLAYRILDQKQPGLLATR